MKKMIRVFCRSCVKGWFFAVALNALVLAMVVFSLFQDYRKEQESALRAGESLSWILVDDVVRLLDKIDLSLRTVQDELERQAQRGGIDRAEIESFLTRHDNRLPESMGLRVLDARGVAQYAAANAQDVAFPIAGMAFFRHLRENSLQGMAISPPLTVDTLPETLIILARRRESSSGEFLGVVAAALPVRALVAMFSKVNVGPSGNVGMWDRTPVLLARFARNDAPIAGVTTPSAVLRGLIETDQPSASYRAQSGVDGIERLFHLRRVGEWPLYLVVGLSEADFMADWRHRSWVLAGMNLLFLVISIGFVVLIRRAMNAIDSARLEAERAHHRSQLILDSSGEGICGIGSDGQLTFINQAALDMLGWREGNIPSQSFHDLTHHHRADGSEYPAEECPISQMLDSRLATGCRRVEDEVYWRQDGTSFPVEYMVSPIIEHGHLAGAVNVFRDISRRKQAETRMLFVNESLRLLNNIASLPQGSLGSRLKEALRLGCQHLGLELGIISRITGQDYRVEYCTTPPGHPMNDGDLFELGDTYCHITLDSRDVFAVPEMGQSEYSGHPCYRTFRLECYIGVPLVVQDEVYGTVNFSSARPYGRDFDAADFEFMRLLARWIGSTIAEEFRKSQLLRLATTDSLTGLANRRRFLEAGAEEIERSRRYGRPLSLLMLDIDHFKAINDRHGHDVGDDALRTFSKAIQDNLRDTDLAGRLGGEEFGVLLAETDAAGAMELANRLRQAVADIRMAAGGTTLAFTVSIGVKQLAAGDSLETLLHCADIALYEAKARGRNQALLFQPENHPENRDAREASPI